LRYGWHGRRALEAQINEQARQEIWQEYMAAIAHSIGTIMSKFGGAEYPMPTFNELMHPEMNKEDTRSGTDIVNDLMNRLRGEEEIGQSI
jgi:hypothetical protein